MHPIGLGNEESRITCFTWLWPFRPEKNATHFLHLVWSRHNSFSLFFFAGQKLKNLTFADMLLLLDVFFSSAFPRKTSSENKIMTTLHHDFLFFEGHAAAETRGGAWISEVWQWGKLKWLHQPSRWLIYEGWIKNSWNLYLRWTGRYYWHIDIYIYMCVCVYMYTHTSLVIFLYMYISFLWTNPVISNLFLGAGCFEGFLDSKTRSMEAMVTCRFQPFMSVHVLIFHYGVFMIVCSLTVTVFLFSIGCS